MMELLYRLFGYRKPGIKVGESDRYVKFGEVPIRKLSDRQWIELSANYYKDQGRVGSCACATLCALVEDIVISDTKDMLFEIPWKPMWEQLKAMGLASDSQGSSLLDNIWYGQNIGFTALNGDLYKIDVVERINYDEVEKYIRMGYQVYTGSGCGTPMCNSKWLFRVGLKAFYHCFRICGLDFTDLQNHVLRCETTWRRYGIRNSSQFYYPTDKTNKLMSKYVFTIKKVQ